MIKISSFSCLEVNTTEILNVIYCSAEKAFAEVKLLSLLTLFGMWKLLFRGSRSDGLTTNLSMPTTLSFRASPICLHLAQNPLHIFLSTAYCLSIQMSFQSHNCFCIESFLWQIVPDTDHPLEFAPDVSLKPLPIHLNLCTLVLESSTMGVRDCEHSLSPCSP